MCIQVQIYLKLKSLNSPGLSCPLLGLFSPQAASPHADQEQRISRSSAMQQPPYPHPRLPMVDHSSMRSHLSISHSHHSLCMEPPSPN